MNIDLRRLVRTGMLASFAVFYMSVVGMVEVFNERAIIHELATLGDIELLTLGQVMVFMPPIIAGYVMGRRRDTTVANLLVSGAIVGAVSFVLPFLLVLVGTSFNIRPMFVSVTPILMGILTLGQDSLIVGLLIFLGTLILGSLLGASVTLLPDRVRKATVTAVLWVLGVGIMSEILNQVLSQFREYGWISRDLIRIFLASGVLKPISAAIILAGAFVLTLFMPQIKTPLGNFYNSRPPDTKRGLRIAGLVVIIALFLALPWLTGRYLSDVMVTISLYVLMGLGLNIAVGLAGLLDLGYLTNFAVGAYVTGVLVSEGQLGFAARTGADIFNFWLIIPIAILCAMFTGFFFALPVLRMRGDYLAIATLGFGEIIAKLAISDWLKPLIGGAQGILFIPKPTFFGIVLTNPEQLYYISLAAILLVLYVSTRLNNTRIGRQWMALREDEDVAAAMGINTTRTKVIAFTLSAAAGGLAGALFATKVGTVFPNSFTVIVSINVLSLIIVGGMGSIPGVVVGAVVLVGLPELLREFSEFRFLLYGALLVVMMLVRPEGLWPSEARKRELAGVDDDLLPAKQALQTQAGD